MADVPQDFDPAWYAARYADVRLSGLSPRDHFRRFGSRLGRSPNGKGEAHSSSVKMVAAPRAVSDAPSRQTDRTVPSLTPAIIDRPTDLDLSTPAIARFSGFHRNEPVSLRDLAENEQSPAVTALVRLFGVHPASDKGGLGTCDAQSFRSGASRIGNAWFASKDRLRLMFADERAASDLPLVLNAYQISAAEPERLETVDEPLVIPADGPAFHDLQLRNPLMPILLELANLEGAILSQALLPFPSLLPAGLHWAELKALQTEYDPMEDFWCLSERMLNAAIHTRSSGGSIRRVARTSPDQPFPDELTGWMRALFDIEVDPGSDAQSEGALLSLPVDSIPTISALVDGNLGIYGPDPMTGPYLIADSDTYRPRWSVCLPSDQPPSGNTPSVLNCEVHNAQPASVAQVHLAIAFRETYQVSTRSPLPEEVAAIPPMTVILHVIDSSRAAALMASLRQFVPDSNLEFLVRPALEHGSIVEELRRIGSDTAWSAVVSGSDLRDLASEAKHVRLLSISDRVELEDPSALAMLHAIFNDDDRAGSASCALLSHAVVKRQTVLQPAAGGIFPAGVSFATSPRLSFYEPDVMQALPNETFPVVANSFGLTLFRRDAVAGLPRPRGRVPSAAEDIRLGIDLCEAGYRNLSTTKVSALLAGPYARRDVIDPFGGAYAQPGLWENLLPRVTLLRELF